MTHFEQTYLMNKPSAIKIIDKRTPTEESGEINIYNALAQSRADMRMQL